MFREQSSVVNTLIVQNVSFTGCVTTRAGLITDAKDKYFRSNNAKLICKGIKIHNSTIKLVGDYSFRGGNTTYSNRTILIDGVLITNPFSLDYDGKSSSVRGLVDQRLNKDNGDKTIIKNVVMDDMNQNEAIVSDTLLTGSFPTRTGEVTIENVICKSLTHCITSGIPDGTAGTAILAESVNITNFVKMQTSGTFDTRPLRSNDDNVNTFTNVMATNFVAGSVDATGLPDDSLLTTGWTDLGNGEFKMVEAMTAHPFKLTTYTGMAAAPIIHPIDNSALAAGIQAAGVTDISIYNFDSLVIDGLTLENQLVGNEFTTFATKAAVRHAAIDFVFTLSSGVSNFVSTPSKLGLVTDKSEITAYKSGETVNISSLTSTQGAYVNLSSTNNTAIITVGSDSSTITRNANDEYVVTGDILTGTYVAEQTAILSNGARLTFGGLMIEAPFDSFKFYGDNGTNGTGYYFPVFDQVLSGTEASFTQHTFTGFDDSSVTVFIPNTGATLASNTDNASYNYQAKSKRDVSGYADWEPSDLVSNVASNFVWLDVMDMELHAGTSRKKILSRGAGNMSAGGTADAEHPNNRKGWYDYDADEKLLKGKTNNYYISFSGVGYFSKSYIISQVIRLDDSRLGWKEPTVDGQAGIYKETVDGVVRMRMRTYGSGTTSTFIYDITNLIDDQMHLVTVVSEEDKKFKVYIDGVQLGTDREISNNTASSTNNKYRYSPGGRIGHVGSSSTLLGDYLILNGAFTEEERLLMEAYLGYKYTLPTVIDGNPYQVTFNVERGNVLGPAIAEAAQGLTDAGLNNQATLDSVGITGTISTQLVPTTIVNEVEKRAARHAALKYLLTKRKVSQIKATPAAIGVTSTSKASINVYKANQTVTLSDLPADEAIYANLTEAGESTTFNIDSSSVVITKNAQGTYDVTGDVFTGTFSDGDTTFRGGFGFAFGGVTVDDTIGGSVGDPHVFPMFGSKYELPNKKASYRMLQGDDLIVNANTRKVTEAEGEEIKAFYQKVTGEEAPANLMTSGVFYKNVYVESEGHRLYYNFDSAKGVASSNEYFNVETKIIRNNKKDGKYMADACVAQAEVTFNHSVYGETKLTFKKYANPQMKYGLSARCDDPRGLSGLLAREYECASMELTNLKETEAVEGVLGKNKVLSHFNH